MIFEYWILEVNTWMNGLESCMSIVVGLWQSMGHIFTAACQIELIFETPER